MFIVKNNNNKVTRVIGKCVLMAERSLNKSMIK